MAGLPGSHVHQWGKIYTGDQVKTYSPIDTELNLCTALKGNREDAGVAITAAGKAQKEWAATPWQKRVKAIRAVAGKISDSLFELSAAMVFEVGKNRIEALGEVQETVDLLEYYADSMEKNNGFITEMGKYNPDDPKEQNFSLLKPYGVWVVISPFNFPMALSAAPIAAALLTGNTVVFKEPRMWH